MDIKNLQVQIGRWHAANFPQDPDGSVMVVGEEVGELLRAVVKGRQNVRGGPERWEPEKRKEVGDVFISLVCFCNQNGIDLASAVRDRWETVGARVASSAEEQTR